jgi:ZIP family zinc transporter/zinc and cadmium transporter
MQSLNPAIIRSSIAVFSALLGAVILFSIKVNHKKLCSAISFSAGALFGAAIFALIPEAYITFQETSISTKLLELAIGIGSGYFLFFFISKYYSHVCPACSASHFDEQTTRRFSEIALALITALSFHSLLDGLAISTGQADDSIFAAIVTHKFPEGLALASLMYSANYKKSKIVFYVIGVEMITVVGAVLGSVFNGILSPTVLGGLTAHIAGGFIFLAIHAVHGEMLRHHTRLVLISLFLGICLIFGVHSIFI